MKCFSSFQICYITLPATSCDHFTYIKFNKIKCFSPFQICSHLLHPPPSHHVTISPLTIRYLLMDPLTSCDYFASHIEVFILMDSCSLIFRSNYRIDHLHKMTYINIFHPLLLSITFSIMSN